MKYIILTFDDGRNDNYNFAYPIMNKYNLKGTIYCTTGFIDGTWAKKNDWLSAEKALSIYQINELKRNGWEIALHGDKHITNHFDTRIAIGKYKEWGLMDSEVGYSLPDSLIDRVSFDEYKKEVFPIPIKYIRGGRAIDTKKIKNKVLFGLYTYFGFQKAYNLFNNNNVFSLKKYDKSKIPSIVIRFKDKPKMILKFIEKMSDQTCGVLMFHSILPDNSPYYGKDPWNWNASNFDKLCKGLKKMIDSGIIIVSPLEKVLRLNGERCYE